MDSTQKKNISYRTLASFVRIVYSLNDATEEANKVVLDEAIRITKDGHGSMEALVEVSENLLVALECSMRIISNVRILAAKIGKNLPDEHTPKGDNFLALLRQLSKAKDQEETNRACEEIMNLEFDESNYQ
jgi:hypothetical protein